MYTNPLNYALNIILRITNRQLQTHSILFAVLSSLDITLFIISTLSSPTKRSRSVDESSPLLLPYFTSNPDPLPPSVDDDDTITTGGVAKLFQALLISFAWVFDAQQTFISIFTDASPSWHCTDPGDSTCSSAATPCNLPAASWAWDHPCRTSTVSDWSLHCSGPAIAGLPASAFFLGCLFGGLALAPVADTLLGRKALLFLSCLTMSFTGMLTVAAPNLWVYTAIRFVCGAGRAAIGTCAIVLATETVGKRWRDKISIAGFFCFTLGFLSLPAIAYLARGSSWRVLYLSTSIPSLLYSIAVYFLVGESPRWLRVRGRRRRDDDDDVFFTMRTLWAKKWARRRLASVMTVGFGVGIVYYGMPLSSGSLGSNLYLSVTINALAELPSALATFCLIGVLNRRSAMHALTTVSGMCGVLCVFVRAEGLRVGAEVVSFFSACTAFSVVLIYTIELFPTCVRNSVVGMVRQAFVFGGVFAPMLVVAAAGRENRSAVSFGVFGLVIGCCGLFVAGLPETRGRSMSDTMEEEEEEGEL